MSFKPLVLTIAAAALLAAPAFWPSSAHELNQPIPAAAADPANAAESETAVLAGGCFWGLQALFEHVQGVTRVVAGYSGGTRETAHYDMVGNQETDHAESVEITFDPSQVSFGRLLQIYFSVAHDPTQVGGQGPDRGASYRSEIFAATPEQADTARAYIAQLEAAHVFSAPITTRVEPLTGFYAAEDYHQDYLVHHPDSEYIQVNDLPKLDALKRVWPGYYRDAPVLLASR
jgi:peptide-methionine (S)-S-oxide reductase